MLKIRLSLKARIINTVLTIVKYMLVGIKSHAVQLTCDWMFYKCDYVITCEGKGHNLDIYKTNEVQKKKKNHGQK